MKLGLRTKLVLAFIISPIICITIGFWYVLALFPRVTQAVIPALITWFILIPIISIIMVMVINRYIKPVLLLLYKEGEKTDSMAGEALEAALKFPLIVSSFTIFYWMVVVAIMMIAIFQFVTFPMSEVAKIAFSALTLGILVTLFQNFFFKLTLRPEVGRILREYPASLKKREKSRFRIGIRTTLLASFTTLVVLVLLLSSVMGHSWARLALVEELAQSRLSWLRGQAERIDELIKKGQGVSSLRVYLDEIDVGRSGYAFILNEEGKRIAGELREELTQQFFNIIIGKEGGTEGESDEFLISPLQGSKDHFVAMDSKSIRLIVRAYLESKGWYLAAVYPWEDYKFRLSGMVRGSVILLLVTLAMSVGIAFLVANDVSASLKGVVSLLEGISEGDLSRDVTVMSESEVGHLAMSLKKMISNLRVMIGKINQAELNLDSVANRVAEGSQRVSQGANSQSASVEDTSSSIEEMGASIRSVAENAEVLSASADESSSSVFEMSATIGEVAENVGILSSSVEETTSAISQMAIANRQVAENAEVLSNITDETASSMMEMDSSIKEVEFSVNETSKLSEKVGDDARMGVQAVDSTIKGIDRIKVAVQEAAMVINSLGGRTAEIGKILGVIEEVAEETNLLALNAAILAAQAGEHGRGFAVVADEIRDLAERTAASTKEIAVLIQAVQEESNKAVGAMAAGAQSVEEGVQLSRRAGGALEKILESIKRSNEMVAGIAKATVDQTKSSKHITEAVEKIAEMAQETTGATQEQAQGSEQIMKAAEQMKGVTLQVKKTTQEQAQESKLITQSMEKIMEMVRQINKATQEQTLGTEQVSKAMENIKEVTQSNLSSSTEMFTAVEVLKEEVNHLKEEVNNFRL